MATRDELVVALAGRYAASNRMERLARLYSSLRLFVNFFQPSFKLAGKKRDGAKVKKSIIRRPCLIKGCWRMRRTSEEVQRKVIAIHATLDLVLLLRSIRAAQHELVEITDRPVADEATPPGAPTMEQFPVGLRTAWRKGEV
jgi:hypothetical protein